MSAKPTRNGKTGQNRGIALSFFSNRGEKKKDGSDRLEIWIKFAFVIVLVYFLALDVYLLIRNTSLTEPGSWIEEIVSGTIFGRGVRDVPDNPESKAMHQILDGEVMIRQVDQPEQ